MPSNYHSIKTHPRCHAAAAKPRKRNWRAYEAEQRRRYDLEVWFSEELLMPRNWLNQRKSYGRRQRPYAYSTAALLATLQLGAILRLPLRGAEHFTGSLLRLMGAPRKIIAPDHSTLCRARRRLHAHVASLARACGGSPPRVILVDGTGLRVYGDGEWLAARHGVQREAKWRRLTVAVDHATGRVLAHSLQPTSGAGTGELSQLPALIDALPGRGASVAEIIGDGLYDARSAYLAAEKLKAWLIVPPGADAAYGMHAERDRHVKTIRWHGRDEWAQRVGYGRRALVETAIGRLKQLTGAQLAARTLEGQRAEVAVRVAAVNTITNPVLQLRGA